MTTSTPAEIEQAAVDAISKVVNVTSWERLDDRRPGKTPDRRLPPIPNPGASHGLRCDRIELFTAYVFVVA